jgi:hypothetical protein
MSSMPLYFLLLDQSHFHQRLRPALGASWRQRSFDPCRALCSDLLSAARAFADQYHVSREEMLLPKVVEGLAFNNQFWTALAGELLWYSARAIPEMQTAADELCCLLAPVHFAQGELPRKRFASIQQIHFGANDLVFGGRFYRPEHAGYNDGPDVLRLTEYLESINPEAWKPADLAAFPELVDEEERVEELEYLREWFPALRELYGEARRRGEIVICETLAPLSSVP